jgi:hypothetical protein
MRTFVSTFALAAAVSLASLTAAERPALAQAAQPHDVVMLKNGGLLRGNISEYEPGSHVVLVTIAGETRRINASDVSYAGPAANAPGAARGREGPPSLVTVNAPAAPLRLRSDQGDVTFYLRTGESTGSAVTTGFGVGYGYRGGSMMPSTAFTSVHGRSYGRICTAPCEATVPAGSYPMALAKGNNAPIEAEEMVHVNGPSTLQGAYKSYSGLRTAGFFVSLASLLGGGYFILTSFDQVTKCDRDVCRDDLEIDSTQLIAGSALLIGGTLVGGLMVAKSDEVSIRVLPASAGALPGRASAMSDRPRAPAAASLPGLSVAMTF